MATMMRLTVEQVLQRHDKALTKKEDFRSLYDEAYEFALPQRNLYDGYYDGGVQGTKKMILQPLALLNDLLIECNQAYSLLKETGVD